MHVAVLGAGYAGLGTVRRLENRLPADVEVTLVNDGPDHLVRHEVHRVIRRPSLAETITVPLSEVTDRARIVTDPVASFDPETGHVELASGETLQYDYGAAAFGSDTAYYGIDGLREHAVPLKTVADARAIRDRALATIDDGGGRIVVGGAGLSGVQAAGELAALAREENATDDLQVTLVEQETTIAPAFPENFQRAVRAELADRGVDVRTDATVDRVTGDAVETTVDSIPAAAVVWTGGITGTAPTDRDRPVVRSDLRLTDRTLALGDAARVVDDHGEPVPASASAAVREAKMAATNLARLVESGDARRPRLARYTFDVPGWLVSVGDGAVAQLGPTVLRGTAAKTAKATVGAGYLTTVGAIGDAVELVESELGVAAD